MNKLIIDNECNLPTTEMLRILEIWNKIAEKIDTKVVLTTGCALEWRIRLMRAMTKTPIHAFCTVSMGFYPKTNATPLKKDDEMQIFIPITKVEGLIIFSNGECSWYGKRWGGGEDITTDIATAISTGEVCGRHYEANSFPRLNRTSKK